MEHAQTEIYTIHNHDLQILEIPALGCQILAFITQTHTHTICSSQKHCTSSLPSFSFFLCVVCRRRLRWWIRKWLPQVEEEVPRGFGWGRKRGQSYVLWAVGGAGLTKHQIWRAFVESQRQWLDFALMLFFFFFAFFKSVRVTFAELFFPNFSFFVTNFVADDITLPPSPIPFRRRKDEAGGGPVDEFPSSFGDWMWPALSVCFGWFGGAFFFLAEMSTWRWSWAELVARVIASKAALIYIFVPCWWHRFV